MEQSLNNTYQAIALLEQYFFLSESNALSTHKIQIFSIVLKICNFCITEITVICKLIIWLGSNSDTCHLKVSTL